MTAIVITKKAERGSLRLRLFPGRGSVSTEQREVGEGAFCYLLCEVKFPKCFGKRYYSRVKNRLAQTFMEYGCQRVLIYDPVGTPLRRDLAAWGFEQPGAEILKRVLFEKLLDYAIEKRRCTTERAALVDYEGTFQSEELLYLLCERFRYVTLITRNTSYFERAAERVMEEMGLAIQVTEATELETPCALYVLMSGGEQALYRYARNRENLVLCMSEEIAWNFIGLRNVLRRPVVRLSETLMRDFPREVTDTQAAELMAADGMERLTDFVEIIGSN